MRKANPLLSNAFAQSWMLMSEWTSICGLTVDVEGKTWDAQSLVMKTTLDIMDGAESR